MVYPHFLAEAGKIGRTFDGQMIRSSRGGSQLHHPHPIQNLANRDPTGVVPPYSG